MLWEWLLKELDAADARRRERLAALRTQAELQTLARRVRETFLAAIGGFPERTPLNAKVVGTVARRGYVIEKILFESRPRYYVTANLYRPERMTGPVPAVIESCGHYGAGKAAPDYQKACAGLAIKGILAMAFDPMGQGERRMCPELKDSSGSGEHGVAGRTSLLVGRPLAHYRIWDAVRALDYLETRPEVDKARLGMFGHSGGGTMTLFTAPLEPRIKAAVSCCAVASFHSKTRALLMADAEQIVPGVYVEGIDHPELIAACAPRAFLIGACLEDFVPLAGTRRTFAEVEALYGRAGTTGSLEKVETPGPHLLNPALREALYAFMLRNLAGTESDAREPALAVENVDTLRCTTTGRVMDLPGARSVFDINRDYAAELVLHRKPADLRRLLGLPVETKRETGIELPSKLTRSRAEALVVLVGPRRNAALAQALARHGCSVMELDLRGWGETTPDMPDVNANYPWEDMVAWRGIEMGRPLVGMRVLDLLAAVEEVHRKYKQVFVLGMDAGGVVALHAAAVSRTIAGVAVVGSLGSYQEIIERRVSPDPISNLVPAALAHYDLPELVDRIRPRPYLSLEQAEVGGILEGLQLM